LEEPAERHGRDERTAVGDAEDGTPCSQTGRDFEPAARDVVLDRVREEVRDEPLYEDWIAADRGGLEDQDIVQSAAIVRTSRVERDCRQIDLVLTRDPAAAPGKCEASLEQTFLLKTGVEDLLSNLSPGGSTREWIRESQLEQSSLGRQRRA
jgi:hypothetical protein